MNYKLAKQLKEAGFKPSFKEYEKRRSLECQNPNEWNDEQIYEPSLSELIEACGENFFQLEREYDSYTFETLNWSCYPHINSGINEMIRGSTPEEAVAKLWLELNK